MAMDENFCSRNSCGQIEGPSSSSPDVIGALRIYGSPPPVFAQVFGSLQVESRVQVRLLQSVLRDGMRKHAGKHQETYLAKLYNDLERMARRSVEEVWTGWDEEPPAEGPKGGYGPETAARQAATVHRVIGPTILLGSGTYFDFEDPVSSEITIEDIAYGLGFECRFAGQCVSAVTGKRAFYTVAQHSVIMSRIVPPDHAYDALMHETGEATCGDMTSPLKGICPDYKAVEKRCEAAAQARFLVPMRDRQLIKEYDIVMLAMERRDLMGQWSGEHWEREPLYPLPAERIVPWGPYEAAEAFLMRFREVAPAEVLEATGLLRP